MTTWANKRERDRVTGGKIEGREAEHQLPMRILQHWLEAQQAGPVPPPLQEAAVSVLDRLTAGAWHQDGKARHFYGEAVVVRDKAGQRYYLATAPFRFKPIQHPNAPFRLHPGPKAPGQIAMMPVPEPVPIVENGSIIDGPAAEPVAR